MGIFSNTTMPTVGTPIVGNQTQENFFNALFGSGISPNEWGGWQFNSMPAYQGQLTPSYNPTLQSTWNNWSPYGGGMGYMDQLMGNSMFRAGQMDPTAAAISNGTWGSAASPMQSLSQWGSTGIAGDLLKNFAMGNANTPLATWLQPQGQHNNFFGGMPNQDYSPGGGIMPPDGSRAKPLPNQGDSYSLGGAQNLPAPGNGPAGFPGYNAGWANPGGAISLFNPQIGDNSYLQSIAQGRGAGSPIDQTPAWQAMRQSMKQGIDQGADALAEQFNAGGGLFSTAHGAAQALYQSDAQAKMNAQLLGASTGAMQQANQNQFGAAGQLGQQGYGWGMQGAQNQFNRGQQSMQNQFNWGMQNNQNQFNAAQALANYQYGAAGQVAGLSANAAQNMYNTQAQAGMFGASNQMDALRLGMTGAGQLNGMWNANLGMGSQLGQQQYGMDQNALSSEYQRWFASQPYNNPYIQMMYSGATGYPQMIQPTVTPGWGSQLLSLGGSVLGAAGAAGGFGTLFSDKRMKENIEEIGTFGDLPLYTYNFKGNPDQRHIGVMAQEAVKKYPAAVIKGDKNTPWLVNYDTLAKLALEAH